MSGKSKKQWTNRRGAQPVSDLVSKLLDPVIERRAGMTMDLIASWDEIVGEHHAAKSRPEKLNWPRQASVDDAFEPATLVVACDGGHALFLQHDSTEVLASVNDYFGFTAVSKLKLVQKPLQVAGQRRQVGSGRKAAADLVGSKQEKLDSIVKDIENEDLRNALTKLGKGVFSEGSSD
ncbi:MAG: DciA family protein [Rhizobiaceae bacterium]